MSSKGLHGIIMAGGRGTRFWPLSRNARPKQLLKIIGDRSMLQITVDRLRKVSFMEDIWIVAGPDLAKIISREIEGISPENIVIEPSGKNTAPCIGLVAQHLLNRDRDAIMGIFPADHVIVGHRNFSDAMNVAGNLAGRSDLLATIGVVPSFPHTGYGYIQFDTRKELVEGRAYKVKTFAEKPTRAAAKRFLKSGDFLWNSGIFVWKASTFMSAMESLMPVHHEILREIGQTVGSEDYESTLGNQWEFLTPQSVDYGILEKAKNICVVKAEFQWSDVGSWDSYFQLLPKNGDRNVVKGDGLVIDGRENLVHSNGRLTAVFGMDNIVVINTADATLVAPRDRVEEVKKIVELLQRSGRDEVL